MHTLYLTNIHRTDTDHVKLVRAVREAIQRLGLESNFAEADALIECFKRDGHALLGSSPDPVLLASVTRELEEAGCEAVMDFNPSDDEQRDEVAARREARERRRRDRAVGMTPEQVFERDAPGKPQDAGDSGPKVKITPESYETALVLVTMAGGNPVNAAANCAALARSTDQTDFYAAVQAALIQTFPHAVQPLENSDLLLVEAVE